MSVLHHQTTMGAAHHRLGRGGGLNTKEISPLSHLEPVSIETQSLGPSCAHGIESNREIVIRPKS